MLRDYHADARALMAAGRVLRKLCHEHGAQFLVNRRADIAASLQADGVHLPAEGMRVSEARALLGPTALIGASCHNAEELRRAEDADYVTLSPFAPVPGKGPPIDRGAWREMCRIATNPVVALGGISAATGTDALEAGAHGVAAIRGFLGEQGPAALVDSLAASLDRSQHPGG